MASEDFLNGFILGFCFAMGEARKEMTELQRDVDRTLDAAEAKTRRDLDASEAKMRRTLDEFAQKHGLEMPEPLASPKRVIM